MNRWLVALGLAIAANANAVEIEYSDLPPRESVARWLMSDPALRAVDGGRAGARHEAGMLRASANEWTVTATGQRRRYETGATSREWNVGVERTVRLPGKKSLDAQLGDRVIGAAEARYIGEVRQALIELTELWLAWAAAQAGVELANDQAALAIANRTSVEKRVKAGDAARLELNLAELDAVEVERLRSEARTAAAKARIRLTGRFSDVPGTAPALSDPVGADAPAEQRIARLVAESPSIRVAEEARSQAELQVARDRADRLPDPTLGVFNASEAFGNERIVGLSLSVPLPGRYRSEKLGRALASRDEFEAGLERERLGAHIAAAVLVRDVDGSVESWHLAKESASRAEENLRLIKRAYALGEVDLQTLLLARKQSLEAARSVLQSRVAALIGTYRERIESAVLWSELVGAP